MSRVENYFNTIFLFLISISFFLPDFLLVNNLAFSPLFFSRQKLPLMDLPAKKGYKLFWIYLTKLKIHHLLSIFLHSILNTYPLLTLPLLLFPNCPVPIIWLETFIRAPSTGRSGGSTHPSTSMPFHGENRARESRHFPWFSFLLILSQQMFKGLTVSFMWACHLVQLLPHLEAQLPPAQLSSWELNKTDRARGLWEEGGGGSTRNESPHLDNICTCRTCLVRQLRCLWKRKKWWRPCLHTSKGTTRETFLSLWIHGGIFGDICW